jgi:glycosyltransferase involved in cell wall biosynthesis
MDKKWQPRHCSRQEEVRGVKVIRVGAFNFISRLPFSLHSVLNIHLVPTGFQKYLKGYDVLHYHEIELTFPFFSLLVKKPKILQPHEVFFSRFRKYGLTKSIYNHAADLYLAIGEQVKTELLELGVPEGKIRRFPNSVDTDVFYPGANKLKDTLLYVGRIIPSKGLHVLLKALEYLRRPVHLVVIGVPDWGSSYFRSIMQLIDIVNGKGKHKVSYLGNVGQVELLEWYRKASLFVFPSVNEPFGIVLLEALASCTPVISTRSGGIPDAVKDGENALLIPERNNPVNLAEAVERLLEDDALRFRFGLNGRSWVCQNYSLSVAARNLRKIYEELLGSTTA